MHWLLIISIIFVFVSFWFFILSLLNMYPIYIAGPILFIAIMCAIYLLNDRRRFKGFR